MAGPSLPHAWTSRVERDVGRRRRHVLGHALDEGGVRRRRKHAPDELPGVARKVALERLGERVQLLGGRHLLQRLVGVDPDDAGDPVAEPQRRLGHHVAAHRVADEDHPLEAQLLDDRDGVVAEGRHRPRGAPDPRFAVAGEVDRHDEMAGGERPHLLPPVRAVARPAVDEDDGRRAGAGDVVADLDTVGRDGRWAHRRRWAAVRAGRSG